ncbi:10184_t:CDS:1, partial [Racocetra persica]
MSSSLAIETLNSIQLKELIDNRKSYTKTYRVDENAFEYVKSMTDENMKEDNEVEISLIAKLLNADKKSLKGTFKSGEVYCECGRKICFSDFIYTIIERKIHDKDKIAKVLKGESGIWMTVAGKNEKRSVKCYQCGKDNEYVSHNYTSGNYT